MCTVNQRADCASTGALWPGRPIPTEPDLPLKAHALGASPDRSPMRNDTGRISMDAVYAKPGYLFRRMQQIAVAIFMEECKAFDLTPVQYAALVAIHTHPGIDATRLSAVIAFDRSTLGSVIERLEAKALVR